MAIFLKKLANLLSVCNFKNKHIAGFTEEMNFVAIICWIILEQISIVQLLNLFITKIKELICTKQCLFLLIAYYLH